MHASEEVAATEAVHIDTVKMQRREAGAQELGSVRELVP